MYIYFDLVSRIPEKKIRCENVTTISLEELTFITKYTILLQIC